jgi:flavin reductase (DIM6/NTAB) family NADH-FMN oxidoreductase RutF
MNTKEKISSGKITMQSFVLCPFLVVVADESQKTGTNVMVVSYVGVLSEKPPIIGIAVRPERHSHKLLKKNREFTLNLPTPDLLKDLDYCGTFSGKKIDKVLVRSLRLESADKIKAPMIKNSPISLECRITRVMHLSKKGSSHDYFIADVLRAHRMRGFSLEKADLVATTNFDYRLVGSNLGKAFKIWRK